MARKGGKLIQQKKTKRNYSKRDKKSTESNTSDKGAQKMTTAFGEVGISGNHEEGKMS